MTLIAHYPLNGDTKDYSGYGNDLTPHGYIPSDEFIGAHKTTTNSDYLIASKEWVYDQEVTLAIWAKETGDDGSSIAGLISDHYHNSSSTISGITLYIRGVNSLTFAVGLGDSRPSYSYPLLFDSSEWCHYAVTYNNGLVKVYQNGVMLGSRNVPPIVHVDGRVGVLGKWAPSYSTYNIVGSLSDARVYDHALSEKEIKELAKAKVLHYKFDPTDEPTTNVWSGNLGIYNNYRLPATLVDTGETYKGAKILRLGMTVDSANSSRLNSFRNTLHAHGVRGGSMTFLANTKYAASILWRPVNKSDVVVGGTASNISGWVSKGSQYEGDGWNRFTVVRTGDVTTDKKDNMFFSVRCPSAQLDETVYVEFCAPQVEVGKDYSTPYVLGTRQGGVKDCSGFGNDGTVAVATAPSWSEDSPVGRGSLEFNKSLITARKIFYDSEQTHTVSAWVKPTNIGAGTQYLLNFHNGYRLIYSSSNTRTLMYMNSGVNDHYVYGSKLAENKWTHVTWVYDKSSLRCQVYYDGVLNASSSNFTAIDVPSGFKATTIFGNNFVGNISDIRIYATALTPEDILEIYQTRASVDNLGNLFLQEFDEVSLTDGKSIGSNGVAYFTELNEIISDDKMSIGHDGILYVNEIKET